MQVNTSGPQQRISQGLGHNCKPDSDQAFHGTTHSELLSAGSTAPMMCAIPKGRSLSLDSSASKSGKLVCPSAGKYARSSSTFRAASDRAQLVRPVVSVKATASAGHSPPEKSQALLNGVASHTHHLTGDHKHLHHQLQTTLVAAHAVGYCNGIRHQAGQGSLIFSRHHVCSDLDCKPDCDQPQAQQPRLHTQHSAVPRPAPVADERLRQPVGISQHSLLPATDTRKRLPQRQQAWQQQQHHEQQQHHMQQQHVSQHQTQTLHQQTATAYPKLSLGRRSSDPHSGTHAQGQPSSPTAHSGEKRSRVISIAEASSEPHGRRPNPFIKIRCNIRDMLDTCFAGWDTTTLADASEDAAKATGRHGLTDKPSSTQHSRPAKLSGVQLSNSDAASSISASPHTPLASPTTPAVPSQPTFARLPISHLTAPSALLSTGSSSNFNSADSSALTEEEARQAMPPPRGRRATAESVQAAVAAAQQEDWATVAHAAAWGRSFPGTVPFAQLGPAAWNIAFPQQVAEVMTCTGTRRFPRPKPFIPSMTDAPKHPPPALQPPSASVTPSCTEMQALSLSSASQSLHCKAASHTPTTANAVRASRQYPSAPPAFSQYPLGAVLPGPQPWGISQRPYVLSSLPHVMHQLLEESNTDFLQWSAPQAGWPNQAVDFLEQHLPAKKRCHAQQQQPATNHNSQAVMSHNHQTGASQHQTAVDSTTSHRQSARQQCNPDQGQAASLQYHQARRSALTPAWVTESHTEPSGQFLPVSFAACSAEPEAKPTPLQMMKQRARQRVAEAIAPPARHSLEPS